MKATVKTAIELYKKTGYYITNCYLVTKPNDEIMFSGDELSVKPKLNGYAIIPLKEYVELSGIDVDEEWISRIDEFDEEVLKINPLNKDKE